MKKVLIDMFQHMSLDIFNNFIGYISGYKHVFASIVGDSFWQTTQGCVKGFWQGSIFTTH